MLLLWLASTWTSEAHPSSVPVLLLSCVMWQVSDMLIPPELLADKYQKLLLEWIDRAPLLFDIGHILGLLSNGTGWLGVALLWEEVLRGTQ